MANNALVSPNEPRESGYRVAQVEPDGQTFEVGAPLEWIPCPDNVVADQFWYDPVAKAFNAMPEPTPVPAPAAPTAEELAAQLAALQAQIAALSK